MRTKKKLLVIVYTMGELNENFFWVFSGVKPILWGHFDKADQRDDRGRWLYSSNLFSSDYKDDSKLAEYSGYFNYFPLSGGPTAEKKKLIRGVLKKHMPDATIGNIFWV